MQPIKTIGDYLPESERPFWIVVLHHEGKAFLCPMTFWHWPEAEIYAKRFPYPAIICEGKLESSRRRILAGHVIEKDGKAVLVAV